MKSPELKIAERLADARRAYAVRTREDLSWAELGRRVWKRLGFKGEVDTSKLSRIKLGQQLVTIPECAAFAAELGVPAGWLAFGEGEAAERGGALPSVVKTQVQERPAAKASTPATRKTGTK